MCQGAWVQRGEGLVRGSGHRAAAGASYAAATDSQRYECGLAARPSVYMCGSVEPPPQNWRLAHWCSLPAAIDCVVLSAQCAELMGNQPVVVCEAGAVCVRCCVVVVTGCEGAFESRMS